MNPDKVDRELVFLLEDLPNIGKAGTKDLRCLGIRAPADLVGKSPLEMY